MRKIILTLLVLILTTATAFAKVEVENQSDSYVNYKSTKKIVKFPSYDIFQFVKKSMRDGDYNFYIKYTTFDANNIVYAEKADVNIDGDIYPIEKSSSTEQDAFYDVPEWLAKEICNAKSEVKITIYFEKDTKPRTVKLSNQDRIDIDTLYPLRYSDWTRIK